MDIWIVWSWYVGYDLLVAREKSSTLELKGEHSLKIKREKKYFRNVTEERKQCHENTNGSTQSIESLCFRDTVWNIPTGQCQISAENWEKGADLRRQPAPSFFRGGGLGVP